MAWIGRMFRYEGLMDTFSRNGDISDNEIAISWVEELRERIWLQLLLKNGDVNSLSNLYEKCDEEASLRIYTDFMATSPWRILTRLRDPPTIKAKTLLMLYIHALLD